MIKLISLIVFIYICKSTIENQIESSLNHFSSESLNALENELLCSYNKIKESTRFKKICRKLKYKLLFSANFNYQCNEEALNTNFRIFIDNNIQKIIKNDSDLTKNNSDIIKNDHAFWRLKTDFKYVYQAFRRLRKYYVYEMLIETIRKILKKEKNEKDAQKKHINKFAIFLYKCANDMFNSLQIIPKHLNIKNEKEYVLALFFLKKRLQGVNVKDYDFKTLCEGEKGFKEGIKHKLYAAFMMIILNQKSFIGSYKSFESSFILILNERIESLRGSFEINEDKIAFPTSIHKKSVIKNFAQLVQDQYIGLVLNYLNRITVYLFL